MNASVQVLCAQYMRKGLRRTRFFGSFYSPSQAFTTSAALNEIVATQATYICITFAMNYNNIYNFQSFPLLLCLFAAIF